MTRRTFNYELRGQVKFDLMRDEQGVIRTVVTRDRMTQVAQNNLRRALDLIDRNDPDILAIWVEG